MPYAINNRISRDPIEGGIEVTEQQYSAALSAMISGLGVRVIGGHLVIQDGNESQVPPEDNDEPEMKDYDDALMSMFQFTAVQMGYKSWETCAMRAYKPGPFEAEGTAFYDWMETCNTQGYATLAAVTAGEREQPTVTEFLAELPPFVRP